MSHVDKEISSTSENIRLSYLLMYYKHIQLMANIFFNNDYDLLKVK